MHPRPAPGSSEEPPLLVSDAPSAAGANANGGTVVDRAARSVDAVAGRAAVSRIARSLPRGTLPVAVGTAVSGLAVYGFLGLTARVLGPEQYAPLSVLWSIVFIVGPGLFIPVEQEIGRTFAGTAEASDTAGSMFRRSLMAAGTVAAVMVLVVIVANATFTHRLFADHALLVVSLALAVPGVAAMHTMRGLLAGHTRFRAYASLISTEALIRVVGCALIAFAGLRLVEPYGLLVGAAPLATAAMLWVLTRPDIPPVRSVVPWRRIIPGLGYLLVGSVIQQFLINAGPLTVQILGGHEDPAAAGRLLAALVLTRVPLYMFQAVQAALIPDLAAKASKGQRHHLGALGRLLAVVAAVTVASVLAMLLLGPWAMRLLFGPGFEIGRPDLVLLTTSACAMMAAQSCGSALIAIRRHVRAAAGWVSGLVAFGIVIVLAHGLLERTELALLAGAVVAAATLACALAASRKPASSGEVTPL